MLKAPPLANLLALCKRVLQMHFCALRVGFSNIAHAPISTFITLFSIGICLSFPMGLYLFTKNIYKLTQGWDSGSAITLYLSPKTTPDTMRAMIKKIRTHPSVENVSSLTPEEALKEFQSHSQLSESLALLPENPLPAVIQIQLNTKSIPEASLAAIKKEIASFPQVQFTSFDYEWAEKLKALLTFGKTLSQCLYLIIGIGVVLMVGNTIRLALERHRDEIEVFNLIGATPRYIRRPFLYRGLLYGVLGAVVSLLILEIAMHFLQPPTRTLVALYDGVFTLDSLHLQDTLSFIAASAFLGWAGAGLAFLQQQRLFQSPG